MQKTHVSTGSAILAYTFNFGQQGFHLPVSVRDRFFIRLVLLKFSMHRKSGSPLPRLESNDSIEIESVISVRKWNAELNVSLSFLRDILRGYISY